MNLTWPLALVILGCLAFLAFLIWIETKKRDQKKKPFTNPFMVTLVAGIFLSLMIFVMEAVDILPENWSREHPWVFLLIFLGVFFASATYLRWLKPKDIDELKRIVIKRLWEDGNARVYEGKGARDPWIAYEVVETTDESKIFNKVVNFLVLAKGVGNKVQAYLISLDLIDGKPLLWKPNPAKEVIDKKFGKDVTANLDIDKIVAEQGFVGEDAVSATGESRDTD